MEKTDKGAPLDPFDWMMDLMQWQMRVACQMSLYPWRCAAGVPAPSVKPSDKAALTRAGSRKAEAFTDDVIQADAVGGAKKPKE